MNAQDGSAEHNSSDHGVEKDAEAGENSHEGKVLRRGWTTGACATAATKSALAKLLLNTFADPVDITLPGGQTPAFALAHELAGENDGLAWAEAGIIKDAGDDPDVTHGALVIVRVQAGQTGTGVRFFAGSGVGTVTKAGLPLDVGEPAINPVPRQMMRDVVEQLCTQANAAGDIEITISVRDGERLALKTWNPRLGILGGLSILGTTGIVVPYSCSAWIHSIHRGVDVARAMGLTHLVGSTGDLSEKAAMADLNLVTEAYIDMGDFVGGMLKYIKQHPVERTTIAGGFGKLVKLAQGARDLHSARSQVDLDFLAKEVDQLGGTPQLVEQTRDANSAAEVLSLCTKNNLAIGDKIAQNAAKVAQEIVDSSTTQIDALVINRRGDIVGRS